MATWAGQRRFLYGSLTLLAVVIVVGVPAFFLFYRAPTCTDMIQNQDETGIDCGGSCPRLCQSSFVPPSVSWTKVEYVAPGKYNVGTYIVNQNLNGEVTAVPFKVSLFDKDGGLVTEVKGTTPIPPHRNTLAMLNAVQTGERVPARAVFEFTSAPLWHRANDTLGALAVIDKKYSEDEVGSSLEVILENQSVMPYENITVFAVLYDINGNTIGFSRTKIDTVGVGEREIAPFTWPVSRGGKVTSIEVLPVLPPSPVR